MAREIEARLVVSAQDRTARVFASIEQRLRRAEAQTNRVNAVSLKMENFEKASAATSRGFLLAGGAIGAAYAAAGGVRAGLDTLTLYQNGLIAVQKKAGLTQEQIEALGKEARALAVSGKLAVPLEEILSAYERGGAAGLPLEELREFATLSAKAADAFEMSAQDVGNAAAGFKVGLGVPIAEMERYFDLINSLADSGISDEKDIINFLDRAGASLKNFGLNAKQAAAYGATILNLKMAPEVGARMMNSLTSTLIAPENLSKGAYAGLTEVVGSVKAFKKELQSNAPAAMLKFLDKMSKFDKFKRARLAGAIFGKEWSDEIIRLTDGLDELQRNIHLAEGQDWFGSLDKSYQLKLNSLTSRWQIVKNQMSELVIDVSVAGIPLMEQGLTGLRDMIRDIKTGIGQFQEELDTPEVEQAKAAVADLMSQVESFLGIETEGSKVQKFFRDLATVVNATAKAVNEVMPVIKFIADPSSGITKLSPEEIQARKAEASASGQGGGLFGWAQGYMNALGDVLVAPGEKPVRRRVAAGAAPQGFLYDARDAVVDYHDWMESVHAGWAAVPASAAPPGDLRSEVGGALKSVGDGNRAVLDLYRQPDEGAQASATVETFGTFSAQGSRSNVGALREAIEAAAPPIEKAGDAAAASITEAARSIETAGQRAADALASVTFSLPALSATPRGANANVGQSMPSAGTPGGW